MGFSRFLAGLAVAAVVVALASAHPPATSEPATTSPVSTIAPATSTSASAPSPRVGAVMPLQEFRTSRNAGWYYTLKPSEAEWATKKFKFVRHGNVALMRTQPAPGTTPVHRLRVRVGEPSYLLSIDRDEINDDQYVDEGVLGYVHTSPRPGMLRLMRFSNLRQWRIVLETRANVQRAAGYTFDAPLGWVYP